jgi:hypothetical protein
MGWTELQMQSTGVIAAAVDFPGRAGVEREWVLRMELNGCEAPPFAAFGVRETRFPAKTATHPPVAGGLKSGWCPQGIRYSREQSKPSNSTRRRCEEEAWKTRVDMQT